MAISLHQVPEQKKRVSYLRYTLKKSKGFTG